MPIRSIIIDDELHSRESIALALQSFCPNVEVIASCDTPEKGMEAITNLHPDLVFMDVQMPYMTGFDVLQKIPQIDFEIIFVTAHNHYAIKAMRFSALDYLLKPVEIDELISAVNRAGGKLNKSKQINHYNSFFENIKSHRDGLEKIAIPTLEGLSFIKVNDIIRCEADTSYTNIYLVNNEKITVTKILKEFEDMLSVYSFFRIHNSHLINLKHIKRYVKGEGGYVILDDGSTADVSRRRKEEFLSIFEKNRSNK